MKLPRTVVLVSALLLAGLTPVPARAQLLPAGGFEAAPGPEDPVPGWIVYDLPGSRVTWGVQSGNASPVNALAMASPPEGAQAAHYDADNPGGSLLYQEVEVPAGEARLVLRLYVQSMAAWTPGAALSVEGAPSQQVRVDVMTPESALDGLEEGVLATLYETRAESERTALSYVPVAADLSAWSGETVRVRVAAVSTQGMLTVGVDEVRWEAP